MTLKKFNLLLLKTILVVFVLFYRFYSSDAIEGFVYDAETNHPLEGVEVEVYWELDYGFIFYMTIIVENFKTKTDKNGYFYFPAWGPKLDGRRRFSDPSISFNRENYERETFGYHERHYGSFFFDSWVIIRRTGYDYEGNKIRLKRLKPNARK